MTRDYRDSVALSRSNRLQPDGRPVWPLGFVDRPVQDRRERRQ